MPRQALFVYGTLLRGQPNGGLVGAFRVWPATCAGRLYRMPGGYPALLPDPTAEPIAGELVELPDLASLTVLDLFEGVGRGLYKRARHPIQAGGRSITAWVYVVDSEMVRRRRLAQLPVTDWRRLTRRPVSPQS